MSEINNIMSAVTDWSAMGVKSVKETKKKVFDLKNNPELEMGLDIGWDSLKLRLKNGLYVVTGIPGSGKSVWMDNIIIKSILNHKWKWMVFSPENNPRENHIKDLVEIMANKPLRNISEIELNQALDILDEYIVFIEPQDNNSLQIENIMELVKSYNEINKINGLVLDPYNEFSYTRPQGMTETEYVSLFLSEIRKVATSKELSCWIIAHPTKLRKNEDGKYPVPTAYDIAGSANFYNKADQIVTIHRNKNLVENPDNICEIYVQKVKRKSNGTLGQYNLKFDYMTNRYHDIPRISDSDVPEYRDPYKN